MSEYTPAPWHLEEGFGIPAGVIAVTDGGGYVIAEIKNPMLEDNIPANARLISAAPDLLEALVEAECYIADDTPNANQARILKIISKAFAKATATEGEVGR